jgi:HEAT repeat protein
VKTEEIYEALDSISEKGNIESNDLELLLELSESDNDEIRSYVAEVLVLSNDSLAKNILIHLCGDPDELVRVNACDSLSVFHENAVFNVLYKRAVEDESDLVKRYALLAIVDIMDKIEIDKDNLTDLFVSIEKESSIGVKIACFKGLYKLGKSEYLHNIINYLSQDDYRDRCLVVNELGDLINEENQAIIVKALYAHKAKESSEAVISTIEKAIHDLNV